MKYILSIILFCFFTGLKIKAETINTHGYYVTNNNDTVDCTFKIPIVLASDANIYISYGVLHKKIIGIINHEGKIKITPDKFKYFQFILEGKLYQYRAYPNSLNKKGKFIFLKMEVEGLLNLFTYYHRTKFSQMEFYKKNGFYTRNYTYWEKRFGIIKEQDNPQFITDNFLKNELKVIVAECPFLHYKYGVPDYSNIIQIVIGYNKCMENMRIYQ